METNLESLSTTELSSVFAQEIADWWVQEFLDENDCAAFIWHGKDGVMCFPPKFAESVDAVLPFLLNLRWYMIDMGANRSIDVKCLVSLTGYIGMCINNEKVTLAQAICIAIIRATREKE